MIPVLGVPLINRIDLLWRMLRSIDYPVGHLLIIDNAHLSGMPWLIEQARDTLPIIQKVDLYLPESNLGVSGSWNFLMREFLPDHEYILIVGNDIEFTCSDLKKIDKGMRAHPEMVLRPANWGHSLWAARQSLIDQVGYMDENFYPAYLEDSDQMYRVKLVGAQWADVPDVQAIHGEAPTYGSHAIHGDRRLLEANKVTHSRNFEYYHRKWGGGPGKEVFKNPFDDPDWPVTHWEIDHAHYDENKRIFDEALYD